MTSSDAAVRAVAPRSVVQLVTDEIRRSILSGALAPGQELSPRELAGMPEVSFTAVRTALRSLEDEGIVVTRPGRSAVVAPLDLAELEAVYRLRRTLEPELAGRACRIISNEELDRLEQRAAGFGGEQTGTDGAFEARQALHLDLLAPAATGWDIRILTTLWRAGERYVRMGLSRLEHAHDVHARLGGADGDLIGVFRRRDSAAVARAVRDCLERERKLARLSLSLE
ncbi:GntR family transcriptional regulator [Streptomyces blattellae]|uniref:GntR family transcriptional regulator n=1 Tax=Streptomyces blattellae TaxID=2569855 RepID=UPI0018ACFD4B|nr:GntR family transcriptional regulator [Streptomyces blattellae]